VATRQGLTAQSFRLAAEGYREAVGGSMSPDSLRRITQGWGRAVDQQREADCERLELPVESPRERLIAPMDPISEQANLSTDGGMVLIRQQGWKEVKLTTISEVKVRPAQERRAEKGKSSRREQDPWVILGKHSYQAGLWEADEMARHQLVEGLRRGLDQSQRLSSVNDGALWIKRITQANFPTAVQIIDWRHASDRLWSVGNAAFGERTPAAKEWVGHQLDSLWDGRVKSVEMALEALSLEGEDQPDELGQGAGYFKNNRKRMQYDLFRQKAYPIGSGTVESGIKTVVHHRMRRPGRGWNRRNGQDMLAALSALHSGRFHQAWNASLPCAN